MQNKDSGNFLHAIKRKHVNDDYLSLNIEVVLIRVALRLLRQAGTENLKIVIIAGPNGAGKTTFAREYLPGEADCVDFINADLIAAGLSPFKPEAAAFRAGRLMLEEIAERVRHRKNFAFETTLSGRTYARDITSWRKIGYRIKLIFLSLPRVEMAVARVAGRVAQGGHSVPEKVIRRRYAAGLRNFEVLYKPLVDDWIHYDNSGLTPRLFEWGEKT